MKRQSSPSLPRRVLLIGGGGREGTMAWKIHEQHPDVKLFCAPGNAGIAKYAECVPIKATELEKLSVFACTQDIDFVIVGPEQPLVDGFVDLLAHSGILVCGPNAQAARITEGSKLAFKDLLVKHGLPTAPYRTFTEPAAALDYIKERGPEAIVIKADGLAAGKGVVLPSTTNEAATSVVELQQKYGKIFIEDRVDGPEYSAIGITAGGIVRPFPLTQDNKRRYADTPGLNNPNTGGMGAYTVSLSPEREQEANDLLRRVAEALLAEGMDYRGFMYLGLMLTKDGFVILEMNCRLGDPETQVILPSIDGDFLAFCAAAAAGTIAGMPMLRKCAESLCVALVSKQYPESSSDDAPLFGIENAEEAGALVIHGSTAKKGDRFTTNRGGRILYVIGTSAHLRDAAYICAVAVPHISSPLGIDHRQDIIDRALGRSC
jgi:phosphoribosylamine---glycine ligase